MDAGVGEGVGLGDGVGRGDGEGDGLGLGDGVGLGVGVGSAVTVSIRLDGSGAAKGGARERPGKEMATALPMPPQTTAARAIRASRLIATGYPAEEVGFEPTEPVRAHALSRRARSAASVLLRGRV